MTVDQWLIDREVVRGLARFGPWTDGDGEPILFDADNLDDGLDDYGAPSDAPLRAEVQTQSGVSGMRLPFVEPKGSHGFSVAEPDLSFDVHSFAIYQIANFFRTEGTEISDDLCLEVGNCDFFDDGGAP